MEDFNFDVQSNQSMEPHIQEEYHLNPKHYYWLFNQILKYNTRQGFSIENEIDPKDFLKMV